MVSLARVAVPRENAVPPFADCYVLVNSRSKSRVEEFLVHFLPERRSSADEFEIPQYSDAPDRVFHSAEEALSYLEKSPSEGHALYWANKSSGEPRRAMVFPTVDGQMIFGISCDSHAEGKADKMLEKMKELLRSSCGYIAYEEPPPRSAEEFISIVNSLKTK
jgi:hypothetical protein